MDISTVAQQFCEYYYSTFDTNRAGLATLYRDTSMSTFETNQSQGVANIVDKFTSLPFQKVTHKINTVDAQPAGASGSIFIMVSGGLLIDESEHPQSYTQSFLLIPEAGSYYIQNDIFRLVYA